MRSKRTEGLAHHTAITLEIPPEETCVLYIGGNGTVDTPESPAEKKASGDAKRVQNEIVKPFFMDAMGIDIPVYAVAYDFDEDDYGGARTLHSDFSPVISDNVLKSKNTTKQYLVFNHKNIKREFRRYVMPWVSTDSKKISQDEIKHRTRFSKISFENPDDYDKFFHLLRGGLSKLGYDESEIESVLKIFSKLVIEQHTEHIDTLFNSLMLPRISENGKRLPIDDALRRIRKITFITHCYGAFVVKKLQEKIKSEMPKLGYSDQEIKTLLNQMLIVSHAPSCRLDNQTNGFISFMSAFDTGAETPDNWVRAYLKTYARRDARAMDANRMADMEHTWMPKFSDAAQMRAAFLPRNYGNMFIIPRGFDYEPGGDEGMIGEPNQGEHGNTHYIRMPNQNMLGFMLNQIARNVVVNGIKNSLAQNAKFVPLPSMSELISSPTDNAKENESLANVFNQMQHNGKTLIKNVYKCATETLKSDSGHNISTKNKTR